jgi:GH25 family lysozyme M1 (1,4-beta-N-acetylmuramidase)
MGSSGAPEAGHTGERSDGLTVCPGSQTLKGVDVSKYQGSISWSKVKASGRAFAFARVSDGTSYPDATFATNWSGMKSAGMVRGAYQFFRASQDPVAQGKLMMKKMGTLQSGDLPPVVDVEVMDGQSAATLVSRLKKWLVTVQNGTGKKPIIYTSPGFWSGLGNPSGFTDYPLWVANWGVSCPSMPGSWKAWPFWQTSDKGSVSGISGAVDLDVFNGSLAALKAFGVSDKDGDGIPDNKDDCPTIANPTQTDLDKDGKGDACDTDDDGDGIGDKTDNCPTVANKSQLNTDKDKKGDACDDDDDNDGVLDTKDNCPLVANKSQLDTDKDGKGDACDTDDDNDGVLDTKDNCPTIANKDQLDSDGDKKGDACEQDDDADGTPDTQDNCPKVANKDQLDSDGDKKGDACDTDDDNDGVLDTKDDCPVDADKDQIDDDNDGLGNACDDDDDGDGIADEDDNCPLVKNADQADYDEDGKGDSCDGDIDNDGVPNATDNCPIDPNGDQADEDGDGKGDECDDPPPAPGPDQGEAGSAGAAGGAGSNAGGQSGKAGAPGTSGAAGEAGAVTLGDPETEAGDVSQSGSCNVASRRSAPASWLGLAWGVAAAALLRARRRSARAS